MFVNMGNIDIRGYEIGFEAVPVSLNDLQWAINGNISSGTQKVVKLSDNQDMQFKSDDILIPDFIIKENGRLGDIYGYKLIGKWTEEDKLAKDKRYAGYYGYKFLKPDSTSSVLNEKDKTVIGNSIPKFNWNMNSSFSYKEFSFDFTIYSVWGMQKFNATRAGTYITGVNREMNAYYQERTSIVKQTYFYQSSAFIEDAGFVRLKNISLSYAPGKKVWGFLYKFSAGLENLYTYTRYRGYDPESTIYTDNNFSDNAIDKGAYPSPKSFYATLNITF